MATILQKTDLAPSSFVNSNTLGAGGVKVNVGTGSDVKAAIDAAVAAGGGVASSVPASGVQGGNLPPTVINTNAAGGALSGNYPNPTLSAAGIASVVAGMPPATDTVTGVSRIATQAEVNAGTGTNTVVTPSRMRLGFAISLAVNGYIAFPTWMGGLIIQWGLADVTGNSTFTGNLPIAFPANCFSFVSSHGIGGSWEIYTIFGTMGGAGAISRTQYQIANLDDVQSPYSWISIGN